MGGSPSSHILVAMNEPAKKSRRATPRSRAVASCGGGPRTSATSRRDRPGTIWLVGMMGAGKSTVGPALAARLGRSFVDTDGEIERSAGCSVAECFAREGESGFRARERAAIARVAGTGVVVALGGGAIAQPGAPAWLASAGTVIHLRARPETLLGRIGDGADRPLLRDLDFASRRARLEALMQERRSAHETASIVVDVDERSVEDVVKQVESRLRALGGGGLPILRRVVEVDLGERSYAVEIGADSLADAGAAIAGRCKATRAVLVEAPSVATRFGAVLARGLRAAGLATTRITMPDGDAKKTLRAAATLYEAFLDAGADRSSVVVALGGGVIGDLAGFAAATYLRGVPFVQVPTTVLAMVDASIGGKVGVNLPRGKNLVGAFHQPRLVWIDVTTLRTLSRRQRAAGMAEVVKAAAIRDAEFFETLESLGERLLGDDPAILVPVIERAVAIKAGVVAADEREAGLRMLLNFGHTVGHAIETLSGYRRILHGEAVSLGMVHAARLSEALTLAPAGTAARLATLLGRLGLPIEGQPFARSAQLRALRVDKKRQDARIHYVVLRAIGHAETVPLLPEEIVPARRRVRNA